MHNRRQSNRIIKDMMHKKPPSSLRSTSYFSKPISKSTKQLSNNFVAPKVWVRRNANVTNSLRMDNRDQKDEKKVKEISNFDKKQLNRTSSFRIKRPVSKEPYISKAGIQAYQKYTQSKKAFD